MAKELAPALVEEYLKQPAKFTEAIADAILQRRNFILRAGMVRTGPHTHNAEKEQIITRFTGLRGYAARLITAPLGVVLQREAKLPEGLVLGDYSVPSTLDDLTTYDKPIARYAAAGKLAAVYWLPKSILPFPPVIKMDSVRLDPAPMLEQMYKAISEATEPYFESYSRSSYPGKYAQELGVLLHSSDVLLAELVSVSPQIQGGE